MFKMFDKCYPQLFQKLKPQKNNFDIYNPPQVLMIAISLWQFRTLEHLQVTSVENSYFNFFLINRNYSKDSCLNGHNRRWLVRGYPKAKLGDESRTWGYPKAKPWDERTD